jgi:outer membrane receptor protein involved in Fe transport
MSTYCVLARGGAFRRTAVASIGLVLAILTTGAQIASAQQQAQQKPEEEIVVTGSRVRQSGFDSPQPLSVIDSSTIQDLGIVNTGDVLRQMPQNTAFFTETNVGIGNFNVGSQLANLRGLNPFFGTRTLTLVDTRRVVPTSEGGAIDLTLIPSMLIGRTEVVTGGASAAYGSDAIAGVVNVILDTKLDGFKGQVDYGETTNSDGGDTHGALAFGSGFAKDKGHFIVGAEYQNQDAIGPCSTTRDWCKESWSVGTNGGFNTPAGVGNGLPNFVVAPNAKFPVSDGGLISTCPNAICFQPGFVALTQQFNLAGNAVSAYNPGLFPGVFSRTGGDGTLLAYSISNIRPSVERYSALGHMDLDFTDSLKFFVEVAQAHSDAVSDPANGGLGPIAGYVIHPDNPYITPAVAAAIPNFATNGASFARIFAPNVFSARNTTENTTQRFVTGLNGNLGGSWDWDAYYTYGTNENHQKLFHNAVGSVVPGAHAYDFLGWALDAVHSVAGDPNSPIVCRATLPGPAFRANAAGCVPMNFFGVGNTTAASIDYAFRTLVEDSHLSQNAVGANFRGDLAKGWGAGAISSAFGAEWRQEKSNTTHDRADQPWYSDYFLSYGGDRGGTITVQEIYGQIHIPIVKKFNTDFAARETHHEASSIDPTQGTKDHDFASWKASAIFDPLDWLRFRATRSRDVRAAGFRELFLPRTTVPATIGGFPNAVNNPWNGNAPDAFLSTSGGNPNLKPETADTSTLGAVFSFERLRFSIDWYEIDMHDAITPGGTGGLSAQQIVNACFLGGAAACSAIGGAGTADITAVDSSSINIGSFLTRGFDLEADYTLPMLGKGTMNIRVIASNLYDMIINTGLGNPAFNYHGQSGPVASFGGFNTSPDWVATAFATYSRGSFRNTLELRYIGSGTLNATYFDSPPGSATNTKINSISDNTVGSAYYLNWSGSWDFRRGGNAHGLEVFWAINNLLDKNPPVAPGGNFYPTNPVFFDTIGQRIRAGVRLNF